jgi:hypothetical protein
MPLPLKISHKKKQSQPNTLSASKLMHECRSKEIIIAFVPNAAFQHELQSLKTNSGFRSAEVL